MSDLNAIADQLSSLTVMEAAELATLLEDKWGVTAAAPVAVAAGPAAAGAEVYLAVVQDGLATEVTRGENRGRELHHAAVTRELRRLGRTTETGSFETTAQVELSEDWNAGALRIVIFAQREAGRVLAIGTIAPR